MDSYREFELNWDDPTAAPPNIAELTEKVIAALEEDMRREQAAFVFSRLAGRERPPQKEPFPAL